MYSLWETQKAQQKACCVFESLTPFRMSIKNQLNTRFVTCRWNIRENSFPCGQGLKACFLDTSSNLVGAQSDKETYPYSVSMCVAWCRTCNVKKSMLGQYRVLLIKNIFIQNMATKLGKLFFFWTFTLSLSYNLFLCEIEQ